jgi:hypothetical protein
MRRASRAAATNPHLIIDGSLSAPVLIGKDSVKFGGLCGLRGIFHQVWIDRMRCLLSIIALFHADFQDASSMDFAAPCSFHSIPGTSIGCPSRIPYLL